MLVQLSVRMLLLQFIHILGTVYLSWIAARVVVVVIIIVVVGVVVVEILQLKTGLLA